MSDNNKTKVVVATVAAAAAVSVIASVMLLSKKKGTSGENDDDAFEFSKRTDFSTSKPKEDTSAPKNESTAAKEIPQSTTSTVPVDVTPSATAVGRNNADDLLNEALGEISGTPSAPISKAALSEGADISHLGVSIKAPQGWEVRQELSPVPNVAMITVWNPEFANVPNADVPGAVPVIILSVEDIRGENLNLNEFKERSKSLSIQQMAMMTGGAITPQVRKDAAVQNGPYRHVIEYAQSLPPFLDIYVINLLEVRNGIAYVFQIMCSPKVMNEYKSTFFQIANDTVIETLDSSALGHVTIPTGTVEVDIDSVWNWELPNSSAEGVLAKFELPSTVKKEEIILYQKDKVPSSSHKVRAEKDVEGVKIVSAFDGAQERKTVTYGDYTMVVNPQVKAISFLSESVLIKTIKSVRPSTQPPKAKNGGTFYCPEYGFSFDIVGGSRVVATKLGNGTVVYAPLGVPQDMTQEISPDEQGPTVTVRTGSPENDPDCMSTLEEWHERMQAEAAEGGIQNIKLTKLKSNDCLTFTSKEMQEVGPGQKIEVKGDVYIFVRNGVTTLIRWETTTSLWRKYERDLSVFLDSFQFQ